MMSAGLRAVSQESGKCDLPVVTHLRAAKTQYRDFVPFMGFLAGLRHASELPVRVEEERIAAVRHARDERDISVHVRDGIGVALEGGRAIAAERLRIESCDNAMTGDRVGIADENIPARFD